ncbi:MAG: hypothetical protein O7A98_09740 [Acidobacteria bacterium]|nr:hypothetical protein [Acidobacteriota bacterium]
MTRRSVDAERGFGLLLALLVLLLISTVASLVATSVTLRSRLAQDEARRIHAGALADAAMARALAELSRSRGYRGYEKEPLGRGSTSVRVETPPGEPQRRRVVATGRYGSGARSLEALVTFDLEGVPLIVSWGVVPTIR